MMNIPISRANKIRMPHIAKSNFILVRHLVWLLPRDESDEKELFLHLKEVNQQKNKHFIPCVFPKLGLSETFISVPKKTEDP
jgi:hypothetical protein